MVKSLSHDTLFLSLPVVLITVFLAFNTCEKPERVIQVMTLEALPSDISFTSAQLKGEITDLGSAPIDEHGILISDNSIPRIGNSQVKALGKRSSKGEFQVKADNLAINTNYYFRAFVSVNGEEIYSDVIRQFKTKDCNPATITTIAVSSVKSSSAISGGNITADGGAPVTARGVCWGIAPNPEISSDSTMDGTGTGTFSSRITGLTDNTPYHVRAYAINFAGTAYGADVLFSTSGIPTVTTTQISSVTALSAISGGDITSEGDATVNVRGICWSTSFNPTTDNPKTNNGAGTGAFISDITGLTPGTTYHVRAYATNLKGTAYGADISFTSLIIPTITTTPISLITSTTATSGGNITFDGGTPVTVKGVCWSTSANPTTDNTHTSNGTGTGTFTSNLTALVSGTTYHVRAYATNSVGTAYGDDKSFTTFSLPAITTTDISSITSTTATSGGNITSNGGTIVTVSGVCWNPSANPTTDNSKTTDGIGVGSFISNITGLTPGTTYHVRAYATNSVGTAYGVDKSFTTFSLPTLSTTIDISSITSATVTSGGNITLDGGAPIIARGVCWSTSANPTTDNIHSTNGTGPGSFISNITGLTTGTTYHVRAYATNSVGTAYGADVPFTTLCIPDIITAAISSITPSTATSGGNITTGCGAVVTARGVCWSKTANPTIADSHTSEGSGTGSFTSNLYGLSSGTIYYVRTYATTSLGTNYGNEFNFVTLVSDIAGNVYKTVAIGTQVWMAENLKTTKLNDGTNIPFVTDSTVWSTLLTPGYCWYNNDEEGNKTAYGPLYNWYSVSTGRLCPSGWHVPVNTDLTTLTDFIGGGSVAGGKLKETGTMHWNAPNTAATDEFNFAGLPGGSRGYTGTFGNKGKFGYWWVNTPHPSDPSYAWGFVLSYISGEIIRANYYYNKDGFSVRCVHD